MALPLAWSVGVVVGWGGALCFLLSPFSALALVAPASGGWLGASLSLVVVVDSHVHTVHDVIAWGASTPPTFRLPPTLCTLAWAKLARLTSNPS